MPSDEDVDGMQTKSIEIISLLQKANYYSNAKPFITVVTGFK